MRNYFIALCILLFVGCTKADVESVSQQKINSQKFHAEFAEEDTRTFVDEKVRLLWTEGDLLTIFTSTLNRKYQLDGETGDNSGTFSEIATSQFGTGNSISANYAVYPYSSSNKISNDEVITLSLPATQQYAENSFGQDANTMVAVTSGPNDYFLPFKNVGGFLRLRLYGEGVTVKSIELKGNNSEKIAGKATVTTKYGQNPELEMSASATESITLDCGDGVALGATAAEAKDFWIVVPPTTFSKGFTITITDTTGATMEKSTTKNYVIERNVLKSMTAFEVEILDANTPPNNQIWYTSTDGQIVNPYSKSFGATITSNVYENGKGIITFNGDVTNISSFNDCTTLLTMTIPESVTKIGAYSFDDCVNLEKINIPNKVKTIGEGAFYDCASLNEISIPNSVTTIKYDAFNGCKKLQTIKIPNSVTNMGAGILWNCENLTSVTLSENITSIGNTFFQNCKSLTEITIPSKVSSIAYYAFKGCTSLSTIYCTNVNPPTLGIDVFHQSNAISKIYVPSSSVDAYKSADGWKDYADKIVGYDFSNK